MKNTINSIVIVLAFYSCKAQTPIVSIDAAGYETPDGAYFKDLNNELNRLEGTWLFINGSTSLTIELNKREMHFNGTDYQDDLIGEYKYIENGIEIVNTLPNIANMGSHKIYGNLIIPNDLFLGCDDCGPNERRLMLTFYDSERMYLSVSIVLRYVHDAQFGVPAKMKATIFSNGGVLIPDENSPTETRVPYGEYIMLKQ